VCTFDGPTESVGVNKRFCCVTFLSNIVMVFIKIKTSDKGSILKIIAFKYICNLFSEIGHFPNSFKYLREKTVLKPIISSNLL